MTLKELNKLINRHGKEIEITSINWSESVQQVHWIDKKSQNFCSSITLERSMEQIQWVLPKKSWYWRILNKLGIRKKAKFGLFRGIGSEGDGS